MGGSCGPRHNIPARCGRQMAESAERFLWAYTWSDVLDGRPWDATFTNTHLAVEGEPLTLAWAGAAGPVSIDVVSAANVPSVSRGLVIGSRQDGLGWRWRQLRSLDAIAPGVMFDSTHARHTHETGSAVGLEIPRVLDRYDGKDRRVTAAVCWFSVESLCGLRADGGTAQISLRG